MAEYETFEHDVLVVGAGGAGLRAAIELPFRSWLSAFAQ
jgi:succinate dehydrogenase/fumarate reductase flavoprotein subunit